MFQIFIKWFIGIIIRCKEWNTNAKLKAQKRRDFYVTAKICYNCISFRIVNYWNNGCQINYLFCARLPLGSNLESEKCTCEDFKWKPKPIENEI